MRPSSTKHSARSTNKKRSTLEFVDGEGASLPNPKQRPSKGESAAAKVAMAERRAAEAAAAAEKAAAAQATAKAAYAHEPEKCSDCGRKFLSGSPTSKPPSNSTSTRARPAPPEGRHLQGAMQIKEEISSTPYVLNLAFARYFGPEIAGSTRGVMNEALLTCLHSFWTHNQSFPFKPELH
jgi:hypothetical protein